MANIPLKSIKFPGLSDTYTIPQIDNTLTQAGQAADAKAVGDEADVISKFGARNLCPVKTTSGTSGTVTFTPNGDGSYTINGTADANRHYNLFSSNSAFPDGIVAGDKICAFVETTNPSILLYVIWWQNGAKVATPVDAHTVGSGYKYFIIPQDATGLEIRFTVPKNTVTSNDKIRPMLFVDKTKHEYDGDIAELSQSIAAGLDTIATIEGNMPHDYVPIEISTTAGLVNKWNEVATPSGWAYGKIPVVAGEKYEVSGRYNGGNYPAYIILKDNAVLSFFNPETAGAFYNLQVEIPTDGTHLLVNGDTEYPVAISKYQVVPVTDRAKNHDSVLVGTGEAYNYSDVNRAVVENPGEIVFVDYGTYDTEIENLATDKTIIGKDKDLCIMTGTGRDYETPPIETSGGIIKHFTVNMVNADGVSHAGYCLHSDTSSCVGKTLIVEDCKFHCKGQHTIGMGIWPDESVLYKDCEFIFDDPEETPAHAPFFAHNAGESTGVATIRFHNCIFRGSGYALKLSSYSSNCTMKFEFIGCTFESGMLSGENMIWTDYVAGDTHDQDNLHIFKGKMLLLATSHGNNISIVNYGG